MTLVIKFKAHGFVDLLEWNERRRYTSGLEIQTKHFHNILTGFTLCMSCCKKVYISEEQDAGMQSITNFF